MRPPNWISILICASLLGACDDTGTEPSDSAFDPTFKVDRYSIEEVWLDTPYSAFYACANEGAGEVLDGWGTWTVTLSGHYTPSGVRPGGSRAHYSGLPEDHPDYMGADYVLIGRTSRDVWVVDEDASQFKEHRTILADGSSGYHQTLNLFATRADGEKLHIQGSYQYKWDGGITMWNVNRGACPEIW